MAVRMELRPGLDFIIGNSNKFMSADDLSAVPGHPHCWLRLLLDAADPARSSLKKHNFLNRWKHHRMTALESPFCVDGSSW